MRIGELVSELGGKLVHGSTEIEVAGVDVPELAGGLDLVFAEDTPSAVSALAGCAAVLVVKPGCISSFAEGPHMGVVEADQPRLWFARAAKLLKPPLPPARIHAPHHLGSHVKIGKAVAIETGAVIGDHAVIGDGTRIEAGAVIGEGVVIGEDCRIYPRAVLYPGTTLGNRVVVHAGRCWGRMASGMCATRRRGLIRSFRSRGRC